MAINEITATPLNNMHSVVCIHNIIIVLVSHSPNPFCAAAYLLEIISTVLQGSGMVDDFKKKYYDPSGWEALIGSCDP